MPEMMPNFLKKPQNSNEAIKSPEMIMQEAMRKVDETIDRQGNKFNDHL